MLPKPPVVALFLIILNDALLPSIATSFLEMGSEIPCQKGLPVRIQDYIPSAPTSLNSCFRCDCPNNVIKCRKLNRTSKCDTNRTPTKVKIKPEAHLSLLGNQNDTRQKRPVQSISVSQDKQLNLGAQEKAINSMPSRISASGPVLKGTVGSDELSMNHTYHTSDESYQTNLDGSSAESRLIIGPLSPSPVRVDLR